MTIAKDFAAKLSVAFVAAAMLLMAVAPAKAQTTDELQKMINDLLAQVASLQGQIGQGATSGAAVCPYTWTRDLSTGATGADVKMLQQFLNADADTRVAAEGVGSAGNETEFYGPATAAAVSKLQVKYRADILSPAGLVNPTGYFGPGTRAKANGLCVAGATTDDTDDEDATDDEDEDNGPVTLGGEADLDEYTADDADDDTIQEGQEDAPVAIFTATFEDGDAEISRIDVAFTNTDPDAHAWDAFENVSLWVDGDKVAEADASSRGDYLGDEDNGIIRFSGLDIVAMDGEDLEITVAVTAQNNLDAEELSTWTVTTESLRFFDADGVATTDTTLVDDETASFTLEVAGADDEIAVKTSTNDPDATTLQVESDKKSTWETVFVFDLDTKDSENDISLNEVPVTVKLVEAGETVYSTALDFDDVVADYELVIDGVTIDDADYTAGTTTILTFNVDGDVVIDAGDRVEAELRLRFNSLATADEGVTVQAMVTSDDADAIDAEGADDITDLSGSATGDVHTLRTEGLGLELTSITETEAQKTISNTSYDYGTFVYKFDVTAFGEDFYMDEDGAIIDYDILVNGVAMSNPAASSTVTLDITGADDATTADKVITEGETATFTFTVETATDIEGSVKVVVNSVAYSAADDATEELSQDALPADDWTSESLILN